MATTKNTSTGSWAKDAVIGSATKTITDMMKSINDLNKSGSDTADTSDVRPIAETYSSYSAPSYEARNTYADAQSDYDSGKITDREQGAANNQKELASFNAQTVKDQLAQQLENYDFANRQNRRLADVQLKQNSRKTEADRFEAMRDLQNAALGIFGSMGSAMNGSSIGNLMRMLESRSDKDNVTFWTQHQANQDAVENAYNEAANQNQVAKNDAIINAQQALRAIEGDLAANLNNINPNLYTSPGQGEADLGSSGLYDSQRVAENNARLSGYLMPDNSAQAARDIAARNKLGGNDYFSRMINRFNGRY